MKLNILTLIIIFCCFLQSCSESKEDRTSRMELLAIIRQLNGVYRDFQDNKKAEEQLTLLKVRDYYSEYTKQFRELRQKLAGYSLTLRFEPVRLLLDTLITVSIDFINGRQALIIGLFDMLNNLSQYKEYLANSRKYQYEDYGYRLSIEYKIKAIEQNIEFINNQLLFHLSLATHDTLRTRLVFYADSLNRLARRLKFTDTLNFQPIVLDTTDFLYSSWNNIKDIELKTPK